MKSTKNQQKVAVIGGGFTGLTAALRLAQAGNKVTLYERAPNLGGLASGFKLKNGQSLERAYHFTYTTDNYNTEMAKELGIGDKLKFHPSSIGTFFGGKLYSFMTPLDLLKFPGLSFPQKVRTGLVAIYLQRVKKWEKLTKVTAMDWLNKYNGKKATAVLWEPLLSGKFASYYDKITMAWLWGRIKVRQISKEKGEVVEKLGYFEGSWQIYVEAFKTEIEKLGADIRLNTALDAISVDPKTNKPTITAGGKTEVYDQVLATTPSNVFANLVEKTSVEKSYLETLRSIPYIDAVLMVFISEQKLSDYYWHQFSDTNAPFLVLLDLTNLTKDTTPYGGKHVYYVASYTVKGDEIFAKSEDQIRKLWYSGIEKLFPEFDASKVDESYIFKYKDAQHIVGIGYEDSIPDFRTPLKNVYLSNFTQIFPEDRGTNFAVRDGDKVARMMLDDQKDA